MPMRIAERLQAVLATAAQHLYAGGHVGCSLALLPTVALDTMPHDWGMADVIEQQPSQFELIVGLGKDMVLEVLTRHLLELQRGEGKQSSRLLTTKANADPTLLAPLVPHLRTEIVLLALLVLPAHSTLWCQRRQSLSACLHNDSTEIGGWHCRERPPLVLLLLLQELLFTSLLLSLHYKMQEVWVYRWWIVQELLKRDGVSVADFLQHDRVVLQEAADKHLMNYSAWNYRRNVFARILEKKREEEETGIDKGGVQQLFLDETSIVLRFFETHNADTSAVSYLIFLLQHASTVCSPAVVDDGSQQSLSSLSVHIWRLLLDTTGRELRRHCDKGHEAVWVLRLALMQWALCTRPPSGWTLQDELEYAMLFATGVGSNGGERKIRDVTWIDVSGSYRWTSYHATRYALQLLQMV